MGEQLVRPPFLFKRFFVLLIMQAFPFDDDDDLTTKSTTMTSIDEEAFWMSA
jgi:hypothetical protein